jgi:hypothetical protein
MKRQIFTLFTVLTLTAFGALMAQTPSNSALAPSQQVDQSGKPETGSGPDVDVDTGHNADNGVLDVDVSRTTDSDTSARGDNSRNNGTTTGTMNGTTTGTRTTTGTGNNGTGVLPERETGSGVDVDVDTGARANGAVDVDVNRTTDADTTANENEKGGRATAGRNLPGTASDFPLFALIGFSALAGAAALRLSRRNA